MGAEAGQVQKRGSSRSRPGAEQERGRNRGRIGAEAGQLLEPGGGRSRPGVGHEHGRSSDSLKEGAFYLLLANISPHAMFHEQGRSRAGARQKQSRSPISAPIQNFIQIGS